MANVIYLSITGNKRGLISSGCSSLDSIGNKFQSNHKDEILVYELACDISREENVALHPVEIKKPIDKSSPLLVQAVGENERLECIFSFYRTASTGGNELYYRLTLKDATIGNIHCFCPNSLTHNDVQPHEAVTFKYASIAWEHVVARTSTYLLWENTEY